MSPHGSFSCSAPVVVNISTATGWLRPRLVTLPALKSPVKTPLGSGGTAHCRSRRRKVSAWSIGRRLIHRSLGDFAQMQGAEQHGVDGHQHDGGDAHRQDHFDERERARRQSRVESRGSMAKKLARDGRWPSTLDSRLSTRVVCKLMFIVANSPSSWSAFANWPAYTVSRNNHGPGRNTSLPR